jgi:hypothetical protein
LEKVGFDGHMILHHVSRASWVRWELVSHIKCPNSSTHDKRRGRAFVLEASHSLDTYFRNGGSPAIEPFAVYSTVFPCSRPRSIAIRAVGQVRTSISPCLWWGMSRLSHWSAFDLLSGMSARVPPIDTLDSSPRALA